MSCSSCWPNLCSCGNGFDVSCADPGLETTAKHLAVFDDEFCSRRLQAPAAGGFLVYGNNAMSFTADPQVLFTDLEVAEDVLFGQILINTAGGAFRRIVPAAGVDGVIRASNGQFIITDPDTATIPDPLTLTTINVTTLNVDDINSSGTPTFSNLQTDTITQVIGLNGANELVLGSTQTISVASFYEINSLTGAGTPNFTKFANPTDNAVIGNELSDVDGIAHVLDSETIQIDKAGSFTVEWRGTFLGYNPSGDGSLGQSFNPGLYLTINGLVVDKGNLEVYQDRNIGGSVYGKYVGVSLAVGDLLRLRGAGVRTTGTNRGSGLQGAGVVLTKYK